jgi:hypothetical protein
MWLHARTGSGVGRDLACSPSDRFARYAFNIEVARILTDRERRQLRTIVEYLRPAHSDLGETTDLH